MFHVHPDPWRNDPFWRAYFSNGLKCFNHLDFILQLIWERILSSNLQRRRSTGGNHSPKTSELEGNWRWGQNFTPISRDMKFRSKFLLPTQRVTIAYPQKVSSYKKVHLGWIILLVLVSATMEGGFSKICNGSPRRIGPKKPVRESESYSAPKPLRNGWRAQSYCCSGKMMVISFTYRLATKMTSWQWEKWWGTNHNFRLQGRIWLHDPVQKRFLGVCWYLSYTNTMFQKNTKLDTVGKKQNNPDLGPMDTFMFVQNGFCNSLGKKTWVCGCLRLLLTSFTMVNHH